MLETTDINDILVVKLKDSPRLNSLICEAVKEELLAFFNKPNTHVVFNLEGISFIDSSGFGVFLGYESCQ